METLPPPRRLARLGSFAGGIAGIAGFLTAIIGLYQALYSPPDKVQIELKQQPIRVELVNPPPEAPGPAVTQSQVAKSPQAPPAQDAPAFAASPPPESVTAIAPAPVAPQLAASPRVAPSVAGSAEPPPTATIRSATPLPVPTFRIATVASTNETDGPRGRAALSFDGDPSTFYTFMAKSDPTVITVTPAVAGAALRELHYKVPAGIQLDNLVTDFVVEVQSTDEEMTSFRISTDPYREGWQGVSLSAKRVRELSLRPQVRYNGRLMSIGEIELR
jgi:hypothetical protein